MRPYTQGMVTSAQACLYTGERRFAQEARRSLMHFMTWDVGWVAMHGDMANPEENVLMLFRSTSFGAISHNHADQNAFDEMEVDSRRRSVLVR